MPSKNKWKLFSSPLWWQYMRSNSDFLLRIGPLSKSQSKNTPQSNYPPPGYGIPPGSISKNKQYSPNNRYGLFLFPGKIVGWFFLFSIILPPFIFIPFLSSSASGFFYPLAIFCYWLASYLSYYYVYRRRMLPILSKVWKKWPTAAYHLFLSVPHQVSIKDTWKNDDEYIYWHPDTQGSMFRQTTEFAPDTQSLQEIILNFAIFECFFQRPDEERKRESTIDADNYEKAINEKNWYLYLFSPIWLNYVLILLCLIILTYFSINTPNAQCQSDWRPIAYLPYSFIPVILLWFGLSLWYTQKILSGLEELYKKVRQGAFNAHLDLVPQQILTELANIPSPEQVDLGIKNIKKLMGFISGIALIGFFAILEVLSQAYGSSPTLISLF